MCKRNKDFSELVLSKGTARITPVGREFVVQYECNIPELSWSIICATYEQGLVKYIHAISYITPGITMTINPQGNRTVSPSISETKIVDYMNGCAELAATYAKLGNNVMTAQYDAMVLKATECYITRVIGRKNNVQSK